jgi:predicted TIM-barrel fold metal-dependent hydrolase
MSGSPARLDIIDFHNHHIPARFEVTAVRTAPADQRARWEALARKLPDEEFLLKDIREGHLGADHVMAGSDWPIVDDGPIRGMLTDAMHNAGLSDDEQAAVAAGNCLRLLGIS